MYKKYENVPVKNKLILDELTGEIKTFSQVRKVNYDDFILVFLKTIPDMMNLEGNQLKLLMLVWKRSSFNAENETEGNIFTNNVLFKEYVRNSGLDLGDSAIDSYISKLTKLGFLIKKCKGMYMLNPKYFFKGMKGDASRLSLTIETGS
jgi:hypothetical protein